MLILIYRILFYTVFTKKCKVCGKPSSCNSEHKKSTRKTTRKSDKNGGLFSKSAGFKQPSVLELPFSARCMKWHNHFGSMMWHFALTCSTKKLENRMASKIQNAHFVCWKPLWRFLMQVFFHSERYKSTLSVNPSIQLAWPERLILVQLAWLWVLGIHPSDGARYKHGNDPSPDATQCFKTCRESLKWFVSSW